MLCLIILLSWLKQDRDRERSAAEGNYHLMIFCFFFFQEPLALHAPEVYREEMCVHECVFVGVSVGVGRVVDLLCRNKRRINQGHKLKTETTTFLTVNNYWRECIRRRTQLLGNIYKRDRER